MDIALSHARLDGRLVVAVAGELDATAASAVDDAINEAESTSLGRIIVDAGSVTFIDSTGLRVLIAALRHAQSVGSNLPLVAASAQVTKVLRVTGLDSQFPLFPDIEAALSGDATSVHR